jgi:hypothetical protein
MDKMDIREIVSLTNQDIADKLGQMYQKYTIHHKSILGYILNEVDNLEYSDIKDILHDWDYNAYDAMDDIISDILHELNNMPLRNLPDISDIRLELEELVQIKVMALVTQKELEV